MICLHAVIDYHDKVGVLNISDEGIDSAYHDAFLVSVHHDMLGSSGFYKLSKSLEVSECMKRGLYQEAHQMSKGRRLFVYLNSKHVHDVATKVKSEECDDSDYNSE